MDELLNQLNYSFSDNFSIVNFVVNILIATILLYILSEVYIRFGNAISNRHQLAKVLILVGLTTFIIISIVKSSLALSLGLVGALSIVRFRTAIKEPEELGYFFISIAIGLGLGANQILPVVIGFIVLIAVIVFLSRSQLKNALTQNLFISLTCNEEQRSDITNKITTILNENANQVNLKRLTHSGQDLNLNFIINVANFEKIQTVFDALQKVDKGMDISFIDNQI